MNLTNKILCIICSTEVSVKKSLNSTVAEILLELFENFAKCMNWSIGKNGFDFNHDPFPFCQKCKVVLVELSNLSQEMDRILGRIKTIATNTAAKIVLSNLKKPELIIDVKNLGKDETEGLSRLRKLEYFRNQTLHSYSPYIALINNKAEPELKKRKHLEIKVNHGPDGLFKKKRIAVSIEGDEMNPAPVDSFELPSRLPSWNDLMQEPKNSVEGSWDNISHRLSAIPSQSNAMLLQEGLSKNKNKSKNGWFRCLECNEGCRSKHSFEKHQLLTCGKYGKNNPWIKINKNTFLFDGIQLLKDKKGYSCGICGNTFKKKQYTQFHVRKSHAGHLSLTTDPRNDEDLETDIKPLSSEGILLNDFEKYHR